MALVHEPELDCPTCGAELIRPVHRRPYHALFARTLCPRCQRNESDYNSRLAALWPVCAVTGCVNGTEPGERYCARCRDEWDALRAFVAERQRQREKAA